MTTNSHGPEGKQPRPTAPEPREDHTIASGRTHWDGCWQDLSHSDCARARVMELERERDEARALLALVDERLAQWESRSPSIGTRLMVDELRQLIASTLTAPPHGAQGGESV